MAFQQVSADIMNISCIARRSVVSSTGMCFLLDIVYDMPYCIYKKTN